MRIKNMSIVNEVAKIAVCFLSILSLTAQEKKLDYKDQSYQLINLEINTPYSEYGVNYFKNGKVVYSAPSEKTIKKSKKTSYIHMYEGVLAKDGKIVNEQKFHMELDSDFHEANFVFTKDGKRVYFTNGDQNKGAGIRGKGHIQLYCADVVRGFLEDITLLSFNETISSTGYPFLTDNDQTLYFSSDRYGGKGGMDLYKVAVLGKNSFGKIVPLSGKINTSADEIYPFIDIDNVLYFSSNSKDSKGGLDVYAVSLDNESEEVFQLPAPVNSAKDDFAFVLSPSNQGFLSSNREGGKGADDIYALKVGSLQSINGTVISKDNGLPLDGVEVEVYENMILLDSVYTSKDGRFTSNLKVEGGKDYVLKAVKNNLWADSISVTTPNKRYFINEVAFNMTENFKRNKAGDLIINMKAIYFDSGKWDITKESELSLDKIVLMMNKYPNMIIEVGSHTDSKGNKEANQKLSLKRAMSTAEYIVSHGISSLRISAVGYGDTQPVNNCIRCTDQEDQLNRRTEFVVLKE